MPPTRIRRMNKKEQEHLEKLVETDFKRSKTLHDEIDYKANLHAFKNEVTTCQFCGGSVVKAPIVHIVGDYIGDNMVRDEVEVEYVCQKCGSVQD